MSSKPPSFGRSSSGEHGPSSSRATGLDGASGEKTPWGWLGLYVLTLCASGFLGAFSIYMVIGMVDIPHNATHENILFALGAAFLALVGVALLDWISVRAGQ